jgi:branched-chain amino acid transport system permease protein
MSLLTAALSGLAVAVVVAGFFAQQARLRVTQNRDLREALITIGFSIIAADLMLGHFGGLTYTSTAPDVINGATDLSWLTNALNTLTGFHMDVLIYPGLRLFVLELAVGIFIFLWAVLNMTRLGMIVRAAIDDRDMVSALGINTQVIFALLFGLGAALAGLAGGVEATLTSVSVTDDGTYLLWSLIVVIIGGMGSLTGAAIGAILVGLVEQYGLAYSPTNAETIIFVIMVIVLAIRPQGLLGRPA